MDLPASSLSSRGVVHEDIDGRELVEAASSNNSTPSSSSSTSDTTPIITIIEATSSSPPSSSSSSSSSTPHITDVQRTKLEAFTLYTPRNVLVLFTLINFVVYFDRGVPAAAITFIRVDSDITGGKDRPPLTQTQCGALYSAFMFGFFVFNPIFVALGGFWSSNKIILTGILAWCVAVVLAGAAQSYDQLVVARALTGMGEAAYISFSVTVIDDIAPRAKRSLWLAVFYATIPFGNAMGIAVNSLISSHDFGASTGVAGWRMGFFLEAIPMAILVGFVVMLPREYNVRTEDRGFENENQQQEVENQLPEQDEAKNNALERAPFSQQPSSPPKKIIAHSHIPLSVAIHRLLSNRNWTIACLGCIVYTASLGALSFFAVSMLVQSNFNVSVVEASLLLGISTSLMGLIGSISGGKLLDTMEGGSSGVAGVRNATWVMTVSMCLAIPLGYCALFSSTFTLFCIFFVPTVLFAFVVTAPMATVMLSVVEPEMRPYSIAVNTLAIHLFGDLESPWITGQLADAFDGGCSFFADNFTLCSSHVVGTDPIATTTLMYSQRSTFSDGNATSSQLRCRFLAGSSSAERSSCVSPDELFRAMRIVWMFMILTIPTWGYLSWSLSKSRLKGLPTIGSSSG